MLLLAAAHAPAENVCKIGSLVAESAEVLIFISSSLMDVCTLEQINTILKYLLPLLTAWQ